MSEEDTPIDSPKPQLVQERKKKKVVEEQLKKPFPEVITREQFINERRSVRSTNKSP
jgi:hypothetical protein